MSIEQTTYDELRAIAGRYPVARSGLLPMLHLVQSVEGSLTPAGIDACAEVLGLTSAEVNGVATFYSMYKHRPVGTHHVGVCTNTLCAVMGGDLIFERLQSHLGVGNDETAPESDDGVSITLEHVECNAACDYAPVVMVNWEFFDNQTPDSAVALVEDLRAGRPVQATRGATITSWREAERVLAGFDDGRADEGPAAGEASLAGLRIARGLDTVGAGAPPGSTAGQGPEVEPASAASGAETGGDPSDGKQAAVRESDTQRAESETVAETETPAGEQGVGGRVASASERIETQEGTHD